MKTRIFTFLFLAPAITILLGFSGSQAFAADSPSAEKVAQIRASAEQGDAASQAELAGLYHFGKGVKLDHADEVKWFRKAADQGFAPAQHNLGICYTDGIGVASDLAEAFKWFKKAADQGYIDGQYRVGQCYNEGNGIPKNDEEAILWLEKAANGDDLDAKADLAYIYCVRSVALKDEFKASRDLDKSDGLYRGCQVEAYMWCNLAIAAGNSSQKNNLLKLTDMMSTEDIKHAQYMSSVWKPGVWEPGSRQPGNIPGILGGLNYTPYR